MPPAFGRREHAGSLIPLSTRPLSTCRAAPFVADTSGLHTYPTSEATSFGVGKRRGSDGGRACVRGPASTPAFGLPRARAGPATNWPMPSDAVGPASILLTVTPVPAVVSARPRNRARCAALVTP